MIATVKKLFDPVLRWANKYPLIVSAVVIYLYYLFTSVDLFANKGKSHSFVDYVMQFDSLFFLWLIAALFLQLQKLRKSQQEERERRMQFERALERQQLYEQVVSDITTLLQDNVNNPLAIISVTMQEIRRKFGTDMDIVRWLDRIDGAISRISMTIRDLQAYEAQKIFQSTASTVSVVKDGRGK